LETDAIILVVGRADKLYTFLKRRTVGQGSVILAEEKKIARNFEIYKLLKSKKMRSIG
jgi:hypothetical protein